MLPKQQKNDHQNSLFLHSYLFNELISINSPIIKTKKNRQIQNKNTKKIVQNNNTYTTTTIVDANIINLSKKCVQLLIRIEILGNSTPVPINY